MTGNDRNDEPDKTKRPHTREQYLHLEALGKATVSLLMKQHEDHPDEVPCVTCATISILRELVRNLIEQSQVSKMTMTKILVYLGAEFGIMLIPAEAVNEMLEAHDIKGVLMVELGKDEDDETDEHGGSHSVH